MDLKEMREKVHKVIFENQSSAIRGLKYLISWFVYNTLKQTQREKKETKQSKKKDISSHFCSVLACSR